MADFHNRLSDDTDYKRSELIRKIERAVERMSLEELLGFQETLRTKQKHLCQAQLRTPEPQEQNGAFRMG